MKKLTEVLSEEVLKQCKLGDCNIIRLENFDNPVLYQGVCQALALNAQFDTLQIKLTKEKYEEFKSAKRADWDSALEYFHTGANLKYNPTLGDNPPLDDPYIPESYVDFANAMTKWRNQSTQQTPNSMSLVLLLGTEAATDKGGLADTSFLISPKELIANLSSNYASWFEPVLTKTKANSNDCKMAINNLYSNLFSKINLDLFQFSTFIDQLPPTLNLPKDYIEHICQTLHVYWDIPSIQSNFPSISTLIKNKSAGKIVEEACVFMQTSGKPLSEKELKRLNAQFEDYAKTQGIVANAPFPANTTLFRDYQEFQTCLTDFLNGKNKDSNGTKLLQVDYTIINDIHATKITTTKGTKNKVIPVKGTPMEAYASMFFHIIAEFKKQHNANPDKITIKLDRVRLADCDASTETSYGKICQYVGGMLDYFQNANLQVATKPVTFSYENMSTSTNSTNTLDPFVFSNYSTFSSLISSSGKWGEPSKISFTVQASHGTDDLSEEFLWIFSPHSDWLNCFFYLVTTYNNSSSHSPQNSQVLPTMVSCKRMEEYVHCESSEEFYSRLLYIECEEHYHEHMQKVKDYFEPSSIYDCFTILNDEFTTFLKDISQTGLFSCLSNGSIDQVIHAYEKLMETIQSNYNSLSEVQKEHLLLILNCYMINSNPEVVDTGKMEMLIQPSYHPSMLEKIKEKVNFLREGLKQSLTKYTDQVSTNLITSSFQDLIQLSSITQGSDVILGDNRELIPCQEIWEYFAIYYQENTNADAICTTSITSSIVVDEETSENFHKTSPISNIIIRNVMDYIKTFPSRIDGLSLSFLAPTDMQHIVAAIHTIAKTWNQDERMATIQIKIITLNSQKNSASYLRCWLDSYFSEEHHVRVNTSLRNISGDHSQHFNDQQLESMVQGDDLCFVYQVLKSATTEFSSTAIPNIPPNHWKYPMVFLPDPISSTHGTKRKYLISQDQFPASSQHNQVNSIHHNPNTKAGYYQIYQSLELDQKQTKLLELVHDKCKWVVCIDKAIDRELLEKHLTKTENKIVGFTTGEGSYGELNVTVSAKRNILDQIKKLLKQRIHERFTTWKQSQLVQASDHCVDALTPFMDGGRILKALNPTDYEIHSFLAYALMLEKLGMTKTNPNFFLRRLVSLDSYLHWFNATAATSEEKTRPDFMLLEIPNTPDNLDPNKPLKLSIQVIECKMGNINDAPVSNATKQLENGLKTLIAHWDGDKTDVKLRYWLNQLYRVLIFLPLQVQDNDPAYPKLRQKIHGVLHGNYEIDWSASLYGFWLDANMSTTRQIDFKPPISSSKSIINDFTFHSFDQSEMKQILLDPANTKVISNTIQAPVVPTPVDTTPVVPTPVDTTPVVPTPVDTTPVVPTPVVPTPVDTTPVDTTPVVPTPVDTTPVVPTPIVPTPVVPTAVNTQTPAIPLPPLEDVRILIGEDVTTHEKYYWEFGHKDLTNRHLLINGNSGCGKTYCIQTLLMEAAQQGISSVIFDYTGGFEDDQLQDDFKKSLEGKITQRYVYTDKFPINPFKIGQFMMNNKLVPESSVNVATRIAETFSRVYKFGDQQKGAIYTAVKDSIDDYGENMNIGILKTELEKSNSTFAKTVLSKIQAFIDLDIFTQTTNFDWTNIQNSGGTVYIIQLQGYSRDIQMLITELLLWDVRNFAIAQGKEEQPFILVMDEAQNLDFSEESPSAYLLTEGRKRGISAWFATQFTKGLLSDDELQRLQQAALKLYFSPPADSVMTIAKALDLNQPKVWANHLTNLKKGECIIDGKLLEQGTLIQGTPRITKVISFEDRE